MSDGTLVTEFEILTSLSADLVLRDEPGGHASQQPWIAQQDSFFIISYYAWSEYSLLPKIFLVIVVDAEPDEGVMIETDTGQSNVAFASTVDRQAQSQPSRTLSEATDQQ